MKFVEGSERDINYNDISITENTRCSYPLTYIDNAKIPAIGGHPNNVIFLTCDCFGVLPPVSRLTSEQAMYHFIAGYTAKVAGTEVGIKDPIPSFSACFGEAFMPLHPYKYAKLLAEKIKKHNTTVWLVNSGWSGGIAPSVPRMSLKITRALVTAITNGSLAKQNFEKFKVFNFDIPTSCPGVADTKGLNPENAWADKKAYGETLTKLAGMFKKNMERYAEQCGAEVIKAGPE